MESWPILFYDIGEHLPPAVKKVADTVQDKLRMLGRTINGKCSNVLLHALVENTKDKNAPKTTSEVFCDIIVRHLYSPGPASNWNHLMNTRTLKVICNQAAMLDLATTAISVSSEMHKSWVMQSKVLKQVTDEPSSKV